MGTTGIGTMTTGGTMTERRRQWLGSPTPAPLPRSSCVAYLTVPFPILEIEGEQIAPRERVTLQATVFPSVNSTWPVATQDVSSHRNSFKMGRVNTLPVSAEVVDGEAVGDRANFAFVHDTVDKSHRFAVPHHSVTMLVPVSRPFPAPAFLDEITNWLAVSFLAGLIGLHKYAHHRATPMERALFAVG
jgi:hypothetical protein